MPRRCWPRRARGVPMTLLDIDDTAVPAAYRHALVLCRTDQHVAWRGDTPPADAGDLIERLRGARPRSSA